MSEYIIWESDKTETTDNLGVKHSVSHFEKREEIVRCRDCKHYDRMNDNEGMCMVPDDDGDYARWIVDAVGYCYLGERRSE